MEASQVDKKQQIFRVCLTGGPCAGKTSARTILSEMFSSDKYILYFVPEVPTLSAVAGVNVLKTVSTPSGRRIFTENTMRLQMEVEDYFYRIAKAQDRDVIIICDRGSLDCLAYTPQDIKDQMMNELGWTMGAIRDQRYDAVIHLVTAADGAENHYTLENNGARTETAAEARAIDKKTQDVWKGHPNFTIVDNEGVSDFKQKIERVYNHIMTVTGFAPNPVTHEILDCPSTLSIDSLRADLTADRFLVQSRVRRHSGSNNQVELVRRECCTTKEAIFYRVHRRPTASSEECFERFEQLDRYSYESALTAAQTTGDKTTDITTNDTTEVDSTTDTTILVHDNRLVRLVRTIEAVGRTVTRLLLSGNKHKPFDVHAFVARLMVDT